MTKLAKQEAMAKIKAEMHFKIDYAVELRALKQYEGSNLVGVKVFGLKSMIKLRSRGWNLLSSSGPNYAHANNIFVMAIDRPVLEAYLEEARK